MTLTPLPFARSLLHVGLLLSLAGCASLQGPPAAGAAKTSPSPAATNGPTPAGGTAAGPGAATPPRAPTPPGSPAPFADVTKDAKSSAGFLTLWTKDDKTWFEIPPERLNQPFFLGQSIASGLGTGPFLPGLMGEEKVVELRRQGNTLQLVQRNLLVRAPQNTPLSRAVTESYSDSLLAAVPLAAAPHPQRKSLLVDAQTLLGGDIFSHQTAIESAFRLPYTLDRTNSHIERARTGDNFTSLTLRNHFSIPKVPVPPVMAPGAPPPNPAMAPRPPRNLADVRSFFISSAITLAPLPAQPMTPRLADPRVGYFVAGYLDFGNELQGDRRVHLIQRWRLEKQDPTATVSEVKTPVRVVLDRNIPLKWRDAVRAGVLEWNKAFEKAGLRNALAVEQQADDADWTAFEGVRMLAVRWFAMDGPGATAVGPSQTDPRTGEILRAAAIVPENWVRVSRTLVGDRQPRLADLSNLAAHAEAGFDTHTHGPACNHAEGALEQMHFGLELLAARGAIDPNGPRAEQFVQDALKEVVMHEVGHTLGLRHNFKASTGVTRAQLRDPIFTRERGISNSIMDYNPVNLPLQNERLASVQMGTLGAYDYWAIEYGYRPLAPEREHEERQQIAARSAHDPSLLYGTDEDLIGGDSAANQFDNGDDPVAFVQRQLQLSRELWNATEARRLPDTDDYTVYRRNLQRGFLILGQSAPLLAKQVGGMSTSRALAGANQAVFSVVDAARQRAALDVLITELMSSNSFRFDPAFISRLGVDHVDRLSPGKFEPQTDFSLANAVINLQRPILDSLMSDGLAARIADNEPKVTRPADMPSYAEVQARLSAAVWSELRGPRAVEIDSLRRNLQREHAKRLAGGVLRAGSNAAADVRAVHRQEALALETTLKRALAQSGWTAMARAHLADTLNVLSEALRAPLMRQGV